jgi:hypothetical protein
MLYAMGVHINARVLAWPKHQIPANSVLCDVVLGVSLVNSAVCNLGSGILCDALPILFDALPVSCDADSFLVMLLCVLWCRPNAVRCCDGVRNFGILLYDNVPVYCSSMW